MSAVRLLGLSNTQWSLKLDAGSLLYIFLYSCGKITLLAYSRQLNGGGGGQTSTTLRKLSPLIYFFFVLINHSDELGQKYFSKLMV